MLIVISIVQKFVLFLHSEKESIQTIQTGIKFGTF